ncbi:MAG: ATP-dependent protease subunit HslV, partial [Nannocystaceae bacterium]
MSDDAKVPRFRSTTVVCVRRGNAVALGADGQVSMGNTIMKGGAVKVRTLAKGTILGGFAGSAADGLTLFELLEAKLDSVGGNFTRACVELAKDWRQDRRYRRLEALMMARFDTFTAGARVIVFPEGASPLPPASRAPEEPEDSIDVLIDVRL